MPVVTTSSKCQVVIPASIRQAVGLEPGQKVRVEARGREIVVVPLLKDPVRDLFGSIKQSKSLSVTLKEQKKKDLKREEEKSSRLVRSPGLSPGRTRRKKGP